LLRSSEPIEVFAPSGAILNVLRTTKDPVHVSENISESDWGSFGVILQAVAIYKQGAEGDLGGGGGTILGRVATLQKRGGGRV